MCLSFLVECFNYIRLIVWLLQYTILYVWYRVLRCKSSDDTIDAIAEIAEQKHLVEKSRRSYHHKKQQKIQPTTFHIRQETKRTEKCFIYYPETKEEVKDLILKNNKFRPIGSGHSFRSVLEVDGILISLERMNKIIKVENGNVVTVQAGIKIRHAIRILEKEYGLALRNMGNYDRQSLGGAIVGGTHGTSCGNGKTDTFTSSIVSLKMINAQGEDVVLSPEESVNFGIGGIVYEVTLELEPFYYLQQNRYNINPSHIDFQKWWKDDIQGADFIMVRWNFPGKSFEVCQVVEFTKKTEEDYKKDRWAAWFDRTGRTISYASGPFLPHSLTRFAPQLLAENSFVDKYYLQYVDDPAPHHTEWEYAVPLDKANEIIPLIPKAVSHIPYHVEVHLRMSPKDDAYGHLAHYSDVVWFDLNVVTPKGLSEKELNDVARPFEDICYKEGVVVAAHPHKLYVNIKKAGLPSSSIEFLQKFQEKHDPQHKMLNDALCTILTNQDATTKKKDDDDDVATEKTKLIG